jgi:hypothetical protein
MRGGINLTRSGFDRTTRDDVQVVEMMITLARERAPKTITTSTEPAGILTPKASVVTTVDGTTYGHRGAPRALRVEDLGWCGEVDDRRAVIRLKRIYNF